MPDRSRSSSVTTWSSRCTLRAPLPLPMVQRYGSSDGQERGAEGGHEGRETCLRFLPFTFRSVAHNAGLLRIPTTPTRREENRCAN
jgi:hypothetical protein